MSVLIKGGRIVTAADDYVGDIYAENGTITLIGESLDVQADKVIDAAGKYVIPGAIDPHTHIEMLVRRHRHLRRLHVGHGFGGVRRDDDAGRLLHADARARASRRRSRTTTRRSTAASR